MWSKVHSENKDIEGHTKKILIYECCGESCDVQVAFGKLELELGGCPGALIRPVSRAGHALSWVDWGI